MSYQNQGPTQDANIRAFAAQMLDVLKTAQKNGTSPRQALEKTLTEYATDPQIDDAPAPNYMASVDAALKTANPPSKKQTVPAKNPNINDQGAPMVISRRDAKGIGRAIESKKPFVLGD
ncbi:hypothetical protein [Gloeobacter violaceus]|nr:hypothetical protein [Gloeobacter violaceus]